MAEHAGEFSRKGGKYQAPRQTATEVGITAATAYTLRHSHASACHYVRAFTLPDILRRLGHSQQTHLLHYAHVIDAIDGTRYESLDELIAPARAALGGLDPGQ